MAKATKSTYKPAKRNNYKPVVRMAEGGNVSELNYSERRAYIEEHYAPFITDAQMIFSIWDSGLEYDMKGEWKDVKKEILEHYESISDYTEKTLPEETIYEIQDWDLVRRDIDPETDEVYDRTELEELSADNTYNFSYRGLIDLNWRVYYDADYERYFYVIMPHLGGDIRGNYGDAFILEGNNKDELFYRFYEGFISGGASIYIKFVDGSEVGFDSEQDSDVFNFRLNEVFEPTGIAEKFVSDFEKFDTWYGDEFLEETIDIYLARKGVAPKMMAGGSLNDETPKAYIQILGDNNEGKWIDLTDYADGQDVIDNIYDWMNELNKEDGGNREEYEVLDYEGFGRDLYDEYMGANEFEEIIEAYDKFSELDFPSDVVAEYKDNMSSGDRTLLDVIEEMENNYIGTFNNYSDFGYQQVEERIYEPSVDDVYITDTDKRILAGEVADSVVDDMQFDDMLNIATDVRDEYNDEVSELEDKISQLEDEINDLIALQNDSTEDDDEYERISEEIEEKEIERDDIQAELDDIDSRYEDKARNEAQEVLYDEIYDRLENDLEDWLSEYGYDTDNLADISFISVDYESIGDNLANDYLVVEYDGEMYFFTNYAKGGRLVAKKRKPQYKYYIVESSTKKLVSGYETKEQATEQRKLLVKEYPSMRFEIFTLANLEKKTDLDVSAKKDYVELSTLDKIKKVSVDAYRYGQEKVGQANAFLERNDVKGKIKRGARTIWEKTKQGGNWLKTKWREADFGDGKGKAKFFADGGEIDKLNLTELETKILRYFLSQLDVYQLGYSDTSVDDIANGINVNINSVKGSVGSLAKKGIIYVSDLGEGIGTIVYLQDDYHYLHPEYKDYISKMSDGGEIEEWENSMKKRNDIEFLRIEKTEALPNNKLMVYYAYNPIGKDEFKGTQISTDVIKYADGGYIKQNSWRNSGEGNLSVEETKQVAEKYAQALSTLYNQEFSVNPNVEENSFDLDIDGMAYEGGSYLIYGDGSVVNVAVNPNSRLGSTKSSINEIIDKINDLKNQYGNAQFRTLKRADGSVYGREISSEIKYADGGGVEDKYKKGVVLVESAKASNDNDVWDILNEKWKKYNIVNSRAFDLETPYNRGWIDEGISINVYLLKDTENNKYYWDSDYLEAKKNKMADGGMAQLGDVSGMLPSPLPMSTITPMAEGGLAGLVDEEQMRDLSFNIKVKTLPNKEDVLLHELVTIEEYDAVGEEKITLPSFHLIYGNSSLAIFNAFEVDEVAGLKREDAEKKINELKAEGKTERDGSFIAGLCNFVGNNVFMFFNVERLNFKGFANRVLPHEALHLARYLITLYKNEWVRNNLTTPNWWEDKRAVFVDMNDANEEFFAETLERTTAVAMDGWFRVTGSRCFADGGELDMNQLYSQQPVPYYPAQQPVQYVPSQQFQQPANSPYGNIDINSAIEFVKQNPQVLTMLANGGVADEVAYLNNRISNLKEMVIVMNDSDKPQMYQTIKNLEKEKENLLKKGHTPEVEERKSFFSFFKDGGITDFPKDKSKVHFTDDEGNEFDGIFLKDENMFFIGFGETGDFRYSFEVVSWRYIDGNDDDSHARHEASETAEEEKSEHEYDVYDNKRMLENQAREVQHHSEELNNQVEITKRVPAWVIAKMERATTDLSDITHYLDGENKMEYGGKVGKKYNVGDVEYEVVPFPKTDKFAVVTYTYNNIFGTDEWMKNIIRDFNGNPMKFDDIKSAEKFIDNIDIKYPYGVPKANVGALLLASQLLQQKQQQQQPQQPQVVYYVPQPQPQAVQSDIIQNVPQANEGGEMDDSFINDFCITNLIELANELQPLKYFVTDRFKPTDLEYKNYKGRLILVFKEPAQVSVLNAVKEFIERAEDCHHIFEQSVNVSGSEPNSLSINLLTDNYSDKEFGRGGKVYEYAPKKINLSKTKKIKTILGDYVLSLITDDFVYYINEEEGDENAQTLMYNKKGELISDNIHATNDFLNVLENYDSFEYIHPNAEKYRQEMIVENADVDGYKVFNYSDNIYATDEIFATKSEANNFISEFRKRFEKQGYYRDNQWNKIAPSDIDLLAIPSDFNPYRN